MALSADNRGNIVDYTASTLAEAFGRLLAAHSELIRQPLTEEMSPALVVFSRLLADFVRASEHARSEERVQSARDSQQHARLVALFSGARERHRRQQEDSADDFNLLEVLQLTQKEVRHSMVLAWLLDHDIDRLGTHAQGALGFRLFLEELGLPARYADGPYWVRREVAGDESIVDVEVASRGRFLIHIENKIWSAEGQDQTDREWADLRRRAAALGIDPTGPGAAVHAFFLTPRATKPLNPNFVAVSWQRMARVLDTFAALAKPADVKLFAAHYARTLKRFILAHGPERGETNGE